MIFRAFVKSIMMFPRRWGSAESKGCLLSVVGKQGVLFTELDLQIHFFIIGLLFQN
jgi:hypothetical protein